MPRFPALYITMLCLLTVTSCASTGLRYIDFSKYKDEPVPLEVAGFLAGGEQSRVTPRIAEAAAGIECRNRRECLFKAVDYVWTQFRYDDWLNDKAFARTADDLFESRRLGGCSDFALAQVSLFRALEIPSRMVMTANVDWMLGFQKNDLLLTSGHVFIEAWLENRWYLVDSTYRYLYAEHQMGSKNYPHNEVFCFRVRDYWDAGIRSVTDLDAAYRPIALDFDPADYSPPEYAKSEIY